MDGTLLRNVLRKGVVKWRALLGEQLQSNNPGWMENEEPPSLIPAVSVETTGSPKRKRKNDDSERNGSGASKKRRVQKDFTELPASLTALAATEKPNPGRGRPKKAVELTLTRKDFPDESAYRKYRAQRAVQTTRLRKELQENHWRQLMLQYACIMTDKFGSTSADIIKKMANELAELRTRLIVVQGEDLPKYNVNLDDYAPPQ